MSNEAFSWKIESIEASRQLCLPIDNFLTVKYCSNFQQIGTFRDSNSAPIHGWFKYPAGYSYKLVETLINDYSLDSNSWLFNPFVGSGTTSVVAKQHCINSLGLEAHPFVNWVAKSKS